MGSEMKQQELEALFRKAIAACNAGDSVSDFEHHFSTLLEFIQQHPECHEQALRLFLHEVEVGKGTELAEYCMHELRWPEVRAKAIEVVQRSEDWRVKTPLSHLIEAFEDDWAGARSYRRWVRR